MVAHPTAKEVAKFQVVANTEAQITKPSQVPMWVKFCSVSINRDGDGIQIQMAWQPALAASHDPPTVEFFLKLGAIYRSSGPPRGRETRANPDMAT